MATIRTRTDSEGVKHYQVQVRKAGFPPRSKSFLTSKEARDWAASIEGSMVEGRHSRSIESRNRTLGDAIDRYIEEELPSKRDARTRLSRLNWWKEKLGKRKLAELDPATIVRYRSLLGREKYTRANPDAPKTSLAERETAREFTRTPKTVNRYLAYLSHVLKIARKEWMWMSHSPFDGVSRNKEGAGRVRFLSDDEREALLEATANCANPQLHLITVLALTTAARAGELVGLTWGDVDLKEGRLMFRITKNAQPRAAWIHGDALRLLRDHAKVRQLHDERVFLSEKGKAYDYRGDFEAACAEAKVANFHFHDLRHTAATMMARDGATEQQLKAIGGWKSGVVSRYVHIAAGDVRDVQERLARKVLGE